MYYQTNNDMGKINYQKIVNQCNQLIDSCLKDVANMMRSRGVKVISYISNGNSSAFDVDRPAANIITEMGETMPREIILVKENKGKLNFAIEINDLKILDLIETSGDVFSELAWNNLAINNNIRFIDIEDIITPFDTAIEIVVSVAEILDDIMGEKVLINDQVLKFE